MNILFAFLATSIAASADVLPSLSLDLDGDGKPDLVQIEPLNARNDRLSVTLTKTGVRLDFDHVLKHFPARQDRCSDMGHHELKDLGGGAFEWKQTQGSLDGCSSEKWLALRLRLAGPDLLVESSFQHSDSWSMGDDSPIDDTLIDFQKRLIKIDMDDHHRSFDATHVSEPILTDCAATLRGIDRDGGALPMCAAQPAMFLFRENYPEAKPTVAVCPDLRGSYKCVSQEDDQTKQVVVVKRQENGVNVYDDDMEPAELVTDGKPREVPLTPGGDPLKNTLTSTCRRETLHLHVDTLFANIEEGKPTSYTPFSTADTLWTQLDLTGDRFNATTTTYYDGQAKPDVRILDCRRAR